jgi:hypothetical protein
MKQGCVIEFCLADDRNHFAVPLVAPSACAAMTRILSRAKWLDLDTPQSVKLLPQCLSAARVVCEQFDAKTGVER